LTAAQLSGAKLLQYITTTQYPGTWSGSSYGFVLHWKEQVMKYKRLELEAFPPKQKIRLLQNSVGDVTELAYVNQIGDQDIARGKVPLTYESYLELLLSACSTYDKKIHNTGKQNRAVYHVVMGDEKPDFSSHISNDPDYEAYWIDTDNSDIFFHATNTN
jgi:hypothetical protein